MLAGQVLLIAWCGVWRFIRCRAGRRGRGICWVARASGVGRGLLQDGEQLRRFLRYRTDRFLAHLVPSVITIL
jgi:hypothetical protein